MAFDPSSLNPTKHAFSLLEEFKKFAFKGNLIDMAIAIVIGTAFTALVTAFVETIVMPLVSTVLPGQGGYHNWSVTLNGVVVPYGQFLGKVVNFVILAFTVFLVMVKFLGMLAKKKEEAATEPPKPTKQEELLMEIRDLLKQGK